MLLLNCFPEQQLLRSPKSLSHFFYDDYMNQNFVAFELCVLRQDRLLHCVPLNVGIELGSSEWLGKTNKNVKRLHHGILLVRMKQYIT